MIASNITQHNITILKNILATCISMLYCVQKNQLIKNNTDLYSLYNNITLG